MIHSITVLPTFFTFPCEDSQSLQSGADAYGVTLPETTLMSIEGELNGEGLNGMPKSNITLVFADENTTKTSTLHYAIESRKHHSERVVEIALIPMNEGFTHTSGQYAMVNIPSNDRFSPFSISCAPDANQRLCFHIEHDAENPLTTGLATDATEAIVEGVMGHFHLRENNHPKLFICSSSGFAPFAAMFDAVMQTGAPVHLIWLGANAEAVYDRARVEGWMTTHSQFSGKFIVDENPVPKVIATVEQLHWNLSNTDIYLCASPNSVGVLGKGLIHLGATPLQMYSDVFDYMPEVLHKLLT